MTGGAVSSSQALPDLPVYTTSVLLSYDMFILCANYLIFPMQSTFCVNSLAHWLGETTFDDKHTPRDHLLTALLTLGEGYHNFHHQFPMDYRNAIKWYQYDPTKWFIRTCYQVGLASHLRVFPEGEIRKSELTMQLKRLKREQDSLKWPMHSNDLPVISWASCTSFTFLNSRRCTLTCYNSSLQSKSKQRHVL